MTFRTLFWLTCVVFLACDLIAADDRYFKFTPQAKEYSQALNREFATNSLSEFPLPPVAKDVSTTATDMLISINYRNVPVQDLLNYYTKLSGMKVEDGENISAKIDFSGERKFTVDETLRIIRRLLANKGIELNQTSQSSVRVQKISK